MPRIDLRLIDTHAHLSDLQDIESTVNRAKLARVDAVVAVGTNLQTCRENIRLANQLPDFVLPALGIHPTEFTEEEIKSTLQFIKLHLGDCVAVGEIGLDYWNRNARKSKTQRELQRKIYVQQLQIAVEHRKPVSVHGRGAWRDALDLARKYGPDRVLFHWFSGPLDVLSELIDAGYHVSATPAVEYSRDHRAALAEAPLERVLVETDAPVHLRNRDRSSEPADLLITIKALAGLKNVSQEELIRVTTENAKAFFSL